MFDVGEWWAGLTDAEHDLALPHCADTLDPA
jgi:hypothetical protein